MKRVILTIAIVLCDASAFADDHRERKREDNKGYPYGQYRKHDSHREHECRDKREWRPRHVDYRPEYREVRELPVRYVTYRPEYRYEQPRVAIALPSLPLSFHVVFR